MYRLNSRSKMAVAGIGAIAVLAAGGLFGQAALASAATSSGTSLAARIATAFHLDQTAVQKVIDQDRSDTRAAMDAKRQQDEQARLDQAVKDGSLTAAQETLILNKLQEMDAQRQAQATRPTKAQMEQQRTDLETWAKDNGIDMKWLRPLDGRGPRPAPTK